MTVPLVGLTTYSVEAAWGAWRRRAALVPEPYVELVGAAGGRPVLLPPCRSDETGGGTGVAEVVDALDALVLIGGGDVDPGAYDGPAHPAVSGVDPVRDRWELDLLHQALQADLPVLAICRGLQVLNVALGGSLTPHLPDRVGHTGHQPGPGRFADVEVELVPGTVTEKVLGPRAAVRCSHHQAIERLGAGLVVGARTAPGHPPGPEDTVIEAVEFPGRRFVVGVQWHPEESGDRRLFAALVAAARDAQRR